MAEIYAYWNQVWLFDGQQTLGNVLSTYSPYEMFARPGTAVIGVRQVIDGYGKQRGILLRYSDGLQLTVFGPPRAPENLKAVGDSDAVGAAGPAGAAGTEEKLPAIDWAQLKTVLLEEPVARSVYRGQTVGVWYDALLVRRILYIPVTGDVTELASLPVEKSPYLKYHVTNFSDRVASFVDAKSLQIKLLSVLQWLFTLAKPPYDFNAWFVIGAGEYDLSGLSAQLPVDIMKEVPNSPTEWVAAVRYLAGKTAGLIATGDKIRVGRLEIGTVFVRFLQSLASAANRNLQKTPLYLSGYYRDYRDLAQDRGLVSVSSWQLRMQLSETADNKVYTKIPVRVGSNKIEDCLVVTQPVIYYTPDRRPLLILNMATISSSTAQAVLRQEALTLATNFYRRRFGDAWVEQNLPRVSQGPQGQEQRPVCVLLCRQGWLPAPSKGDDFTFGRIRTGGSPADAG